MGQQQQGGVIGADALVDPRDASTPYGTLTVEELRRLADERGLPASSFKGIATEQPMLMALLKAFDAGARSATATSGAETDGGKEPRGHGAAGGRSCNASCEPSVPPDATVVRRILDAPGPRGVDIGGSLVKMVSALPREEAYGKNAFPESFGATGRTRYDLELECKLGGRAHVLRFVSGATAQIADAVGRARRPHGSRCGNGCSGSPVSSRGNEAEGEFEEMTFDEVIYQKQEGEEADIEEELDEAQCLACSRSQRVFTAGGGAHKFAPLFRDALQVEVVPVKELSAVVDGLLFLACSCGPAAQEIFTINEDGQPSPASWPEPLFPFLVVNIGSGVSILRVNSPQEGDYTRVGGTACGGGTFLGLARALTSARTFAEALRLAEGGDASRCDLLVKDIYGDEGSTSLGLPAGLTAANCGRLCEDLAESGGSWREQDLARALLQMVTQQSVLLSGAFARHLGCVDRVFFAGGFVEEENHIARKAISANFRSLGGAAYFLRHSDFLGALGSLRACIQASETADALAALQMKVGCRLGSSGYASTTLTTSPSWSSVCSAADGP